MIMADTGVGLVDGRIRVLRIITRMGVGGPALQATNLLRGMDAQRFDQRIYAGSLAPGEADFTELRAPDVGVFPVPELGRAVRTGDDLRALARLVAAIRRFQPHIVHTHTAKAGALGRVAATLAGAPVRIHTFHGHLLQGYFSAPKTRLVVQAERTLARLSERLVTVGGLVRDDLLAAGIGRPEQYVVLPPGTALGPLPDRRAARLDLGVPPGVPLVTFVGRVTRVKRPDRFLAVARAVRAAVPHARFLICGDGELLDEVRADGRDLGGSLHLTGWRADVETVLAATDVILLTSDNEGTPLSLIEAALAGVPAVATRVGSVPEVVRDRVTGLLAGRDPVDLAAPVIRLLSDPDLRARMGRAAAEWAGPRFGTGRFIADMQELYESCVLPVQLPAQRTRSRR
jgi:glycosyltransferase involved in cell wall biosynthesis